MYVLHRLVYVDSGMVLQKCVRTDVCAHSLQHLNLLVYMDSGSATSRSMMSSVCRSTSMLAYLRHAPLPCTVVNLARGESHGVDGAVLYLDVVGGAFFPCLRRLGWE